MDTEDLSRLRTVAPTLGCQIVQNGQTILVFVGLYGVRWEMTGNSGRISGHHPESDILVIVHTELLPAAAAQPKNR